VCVFGECLYLGRSKFHKTVYGLHFRRSKPSLIDATGSRGAAAEIPLAYEILQNSLIAADTCNRYERETKQ